MSASLVGSEMCIRDRRRTARRAPRRAATTSRARRTPCCSRAPTSMIRGWRRSGGSSGGALKCMTACTTCSSWADAQPECVGTCRPLGEKETSSTLPQPRIAARRCTHAHTLVPLRARLRTSIHAHTHVCMLTRTQLCLSLIHISEPTRLALI
eukprot:1859851-Alexandrium_andersonii.AAC.1